ncbi:NCS2 family permease [Kallipyga massiliensis]|uniref:NCS2 family permease n=1 Tax=Kallipyga massiliensis TaxID=1472764 RepID=UPI0004B11836|nr:NCS2 family permease [Kallipyga massiliensis]
MFEKYFKLSDHKVTVRSEIMAGITTFVTMAYILAVNPQILGDAGMPAGGVLIATAIASAIGCFCMAIFANLPFALAPGMGLNAFFAYTVVLKMGYPYQIALFAVFLEGLIFIVLSLTNVREAIFNAIPLSLKNAISCGIGLFIAFIGLQSAKLVVASPATLVSFSGLNKNFNTAGISALLCLIGIIIIVVLTHKKVKGAILIGILSSWVLGMIAQAAGLYVPNIEEGFYSLYPSWSAPHFEEFSGLVGQAFKIDFSAISPLELFSITFAFLFVDIFDTVGTLAGVAAKADMLDSQGRLPQARGALLADAVATSTGAVLGTSTVTTFVESSAGVEAGGRTGLTAVTTGVLFALAMILSPIFIAIPGFATASALIYVGFSMFTAVVKIDLSDLTEAFPAYLAILSMPLFYSIAEGISMGVVSFVILKLLTGKKKDISPLMAVLAFIFILRYIFM